MFKRPHHQRIARVLQALDADLLRQHGCLFGGGTCIALRFGEYCESVDMDFLISDPAGYRELRQMLTGAQGMTAITRDGAIPLILQRDIRAPSTYLPLPANWRFMPPTDKYCRPLQGQKNPRGS